MPRLVSAFKSAPLGRERLHHRHKAVLCNENLAIRIFQADEGPLISKEPEGLRLVPALQRRDKGGQFLAAMAHDDNRSNDDNNEESLVSLHGGRR